MRNFKENQLYCFSKIDFDLWVRSFAFEENVLGFEISVDYVVSVAVWYSWEDLADVIGSFVFIKPVHIENFAEELTTWK